MTAGFQTGACPVVAFPTTQSESAAQTVGFLSGVLH
jgi:hypothetical protein